VLRRKRSGRCQDVQPPLVPSADAQLPEPPGPLPSHRSPPPGGGAPPAATSAAVAGCLEPPASSNRPSVPAAVVVLRFGGSGGGADRGRFNGRPSAAEKAGAPVVHSVGATAGVEGGASGTPKVRSTAVLCVWRGSEHKGPRIYQSQRRGKKGVGVQKKIATLLCEEKILAFGREHFLLLVLSLSDNTQCVLIQRMQKHMRHGELRERAGRGV